MSFICIVTRSIYGCSGTELPPPVASTETYIYKSKTGESEANFKIRMSNTVMPIRHAAEHAPRRPYSSRDGWDWRIIDITAKPIPPDIYG